MLADCLWPALRRPEVSTQCQPTHRVAVLWPGAPSQSSSPPLPSSSWPPLGHSHATYSRRNRMRAPFPTSGWAGPRRLVDCKGPATARPYLSKGNPNLLGATSWRSVSFGTTSSSIRSALQISERSRLPRADLLIRRVQVRAMLLIEEWNGSEDEQGETRFSTSHTNRKPRWRESNPKLPSPIKIRYQCTEPSNLSGIAIIFFTPEVFMPCNECHLIHHWQKRPHRYKRRLSCFMEWRLPFLRLMSVGSLTLFFPQKLLTCDYA